MEVLNPDVTACESPVQDAARDRRAYAATRRTGCVVAVSSATEQCPQGILAMATLVLPAPGPTRIAGLSTLAASHERMGPSAATAAENLRILFGGVGQTWGCLWWRVSPRVHSYEVIL